MRATSKSQLDGVRVVAMFFSLTLTSIYPLRCFYVFHVSRVSYDYRCVSVLS